MNGRQIYQNTKSCSQVQLSSGVAARVTVSTTSSSAYPGYRAQVGLPSFGYGGQEDHHQQQQRISWIQSTGMTAILDTEHRYMAAILDTEHRYGCRLLDTKHKYGRRLLDAKHRYGRRLLDTKHR